MVQTVIVYILICAALIGAIRFVRKKLRSLCRPSGCHECDECPLKECCTAACGK